MLNVENGCVGQKQAPGVIYKVVNLVMDVQGLFNVSK